MPLFDRLDRQFAAIRQGRQLGAGLVFIAVLGGIDHLTGFELSFSVFYLVPIALSWYLGRRSGLLLCVLSALTWLLVDFTSGNNYSATWIPFWNAGVRFMFFFIILMILTELKIRVEKEQQLARIDGLTGLLNARSFREEAGGLFRLAARHNRTLALAYLDLDNFKQVNDSFGHATGDLVLQQVSQTLTAAVRDSDLVGRLGGDEFALLLPETTPAGAEAFFRKLQQRLLATMADQGWPVGCSIGVGIFSSAGPDATRALQLADQLMYQVKSQGKNNVLCKHFAGEDEPAPS